MQSSSSLNAKPEHSSAEKARRLLSEMEAEWRTRHPFQPQRPTPPQERFLSLTCREALYGGAAGGGKSSALLMAALQYVNVPGYAALLLRRTYADLAKPGALMSRAQEWLRGTAATWNEQKKMWTFPCPSGGTATLSFGFLEHAGDVYNYQGAEYQFIGFDELTQFTHASYRYLFSRLRRLRGSDVPLRMRAASNPGGEGHEWVRQRFIEEGEAKGRVFVPAKLDDNPHLDREEYEESLKELDPVTRAQLRDGNWDVLPNGPYFDRAWFEIVDAVPAGSHGVRYWDLAATEPKKGKDPDWTAGAKLFESNGIYYLADVRRMRGKPLDVERLVKQTAELDRMAHGQSFATWMEQEPGSSGVNTIDNYRRNVLKGFVFDGNKETGNKRERARPASSAAQAGNVKLVRGPWITEFLDEAHAFPDVPHDDQVDAFTGAFKMLNGPQSASFRDLAPVHVPRRSL